MASEQTELLTAEQFAQLPTVGDELEELIDGRIHRSPVPGLAHGECLATLASLVLEHVKAHQLGRCSLRSGIVVARNPDSVLCPDFSFWSTDRPPDVEKGWPTVPPVMAAEVVESISEFHDAMRKMPYYFAFGIDLVWLLWIRRRVVVVHRLASHPQPFDPWEWRYTGYQRSRTVGDDHLLDGGDVLPGFSCKVSELFR